MGLQITQNKLPNEEEIDNVTGFVTRSNYNESRKADSMENADSKINTWTEMHDNGKPTERLGRKAKGPGSERIWQPGRQYFTPLII